MAGKGGRTKDEFPPLLEAGLHPMGVGELKALVVNRFPLSTRRVGLWENFTALIDRLSVLQLPCEIWVDGSFLTEKIDPDDVDFVVDISIDVFQNLTPPQAELVRQLARRAFCNDFKLHSFVMFNAPLPHVDHPASKAVHDQWAKDFGFSVVKKEAKGIAIIKVVP